MGEYNKLNNDENENLTILQQIYYTFVYITYFDYIPKKKENINNLNHDNIFKLYAILTFYYTRNFLSNNKEAYLSALIVFSLELILFTIVLLLLIIYYGIVIFEIFIFALILFIIIMQVILIVIFFLVIINILFLGLPICFFILILYNSKRNNQTNKTECYMNDITSIEYDKEKYEKYQKENNKLKNNKKLKNNNILKRLLINYVIGKNHKRYFYSTPILINLVILAIGITLIITFFAIYLS